ncbi:MAG: glycosyltransferase family 2 protein [Roseiflexaceae bacterium]
MSAPSVWIVILNWNGADETLACLTTLRASTYHAQVLVVDNGSQDGSIERIAADFPAVAVLPLGTNQGFSRGVNRGIELALARGADYVLLLNNDSRPAADMLAQLVDFAETRPACGLVSPLIYQIDRPERFWVVGGWWKIYGIMHEGWDTLDSGQYNGPTRFDIVFGTALLIRRTVLERIGCFDERFFVYYEDVDFNLRARRAGFSAFVVPAARLWHAGAYSTRQRHYLREFYLSRNRVLLFRKYLSGLHFVIFLLIQLRPDLRMLWRLLRRGEPLNALALICGIVSALWSRRHASS